MGEWVEHSLSDLADVRDGTHDSPKQTEDGKFLITSRHIKNGKIDFTKAYKISEEDFDFVNRRSKVDQWDILFSMIGTIAEMAIVDYDPDFAIKNVGLFKTGNKNLSQWIYYYFKSTEGQNEIAASLKGSTQQYITLGDLRSFPIKKPSNKNEQTAITEVLSSLDDKIDLLNRQNKTLEALAETLFRHTFIDNPRDDWETQDLGKAVNIKYGKNLPTKKLIENGYSVFGGNGQIGWYSEYLYDAPQVLVSCRGEASGKVNISHPKSFITNNSLVLEIQDGSDLTFEWLKYWSLSMNFTDYASGSAQPQITIDGLRIAPITIPDKEIIKKFSEQTKPIEDKRELNREQIQSLESLRDTLLPKLMSGEIRVQYDEAT